MINRILFIIISPFFIIWMVSATLLLIPYWIFSGKVIYDTKFFNSFPNWSNKLYIKSKL